MKKLIYIFLSAIVFTSCSMMSPLAMTPRNIPQELPQATSKDPYAGQGTSTQYLQLAREWESRALRYETSAMQMVNYQKKSVQRAAKGVSNAVNGRSRNTLQGYGEAASRILNERSNMLQYRNRYEQYVEKARQAKAEQQRYLALAQQSRH